MYRLFIWNVLLLGTLSVLTGCPTMDDDDTSSTGDDDVGDDDSGDDDSGDDDSGDDDSGDDDSGGPIFDPGLELLDDTVDCDEVLVEENRLVVTLAGHEELLDLDSSNIVVSACGNGYLRHVEGVSAQGENVVIDTTQAQLVDAVINGSLSEQLDLVDGGTENNFTEATFNFDGETLYDQGGITISFSEGSISFNPVIDFDFDIVNRELDRFHLEANGTITESLALEVSVGGATTPLQGQTTLWQTSRTYVTMIGWVPVVTVVYLKLDAGYSVSADAAVSVSAGASGSLTVGGGFLYEDGVTTPIANFNNHGVTPIGPTITTEGGMHAVAWIEPQIDIEFYDIGGPSLSAKASATAEMPLSDPMCGWSLVGAFDVAIGAQLTVLDMTASVSMPPLYSWEESILDPSAWPDWETECCARDFELYGAPQAPIDCVTVDGWVWLNDGTDATQLAGVEVITGDLAIAGAPSLTTLTGLGDLQEVGGSLHIEDNPMLVDVNMPVLTSVGGELWIKQNDSLQNLDGLPALTQVGSHVDFELYGLIDDTSGLAALTGVGGDLRLRTAGQLTTLEIPALQDVDGALSFVDYSGLTTLSLPSLEEVGSILIDNENAGLEDIDLSALTTVQGDIQILYNPALLSLEMPALTTVNGDLEVSENPQLDSLLLDGLAQVQGSLRLDLNDSLADLPLPELVNVDGSIALGGDAYNDTPALATVDLPVLVSAGSLEVRYAPSLGQLALPAFNSPSAVNQIVIQDTGLQTLSMPVLPAVHGDLTLTGTPLTSLTLPQLAAVDGDFTLMDTQLQSFHPQALNSVGFITIADNPLINSCDVWVWLDLTGWSYILSDNDQTGWPDCTF